MSLTIAVPLQRSVYPLYANAESVCQEKGYKLLILDEKQCADALYTGKADIALINPLTFAQSRSELRIIQSRAVSVEGFTGFASIHFIPNKESVDTVYLQTEDFYLKIGLLGLAEKYDLFPKSLKPSSDNIDIDQFYGADAAIVWNEEDNSFGMLDISEEWTDYNELPLPIGFWACKDEDFPVDIIELTHSFAADELPEIDEVISTVNPDEPDVVRVGSVLYTLHENFVSSLESVQQFLYFHHVISEIRAITYHGS